MILQEMPGFTELSFQYMQVDGTAESLLQFLVRRFCYHNEGEWRKAIDQGRIRVDQKDHAADQALKNGQIVNYFRPDFLEPEVDATFEVLYEDEALIAVSKSGNLPTSPSGKYFKHTLVHLVKHYLQVEQVFTIHRLDRETSGLVLFAKSSQVAERMARQFREKSLRKEYRALLTKSLPFERMTVRIPIGPLKGCLVRIKQGWSESGKESITRFTWIDNPAQWPCYRVEPFTGRTHQIRVHAAFLGAAIKGDKMYGLTPEQYVRWLNRDDAEYEAGLDLLKRHCLHAYAMTFKHPVSEQEMTLVAPKVDFMPF